MTTEEMIKSSFEEYGTVERVKKIKDYAFVHYDERDDAVKVLPSWSLLLRLLVAGENFVFSVILFHFNYTFSLQDGYLLFEIQSYWW